MNVREAYFHSLKADGHSSDPAQLAAIDALQSLQDRLETVVPTPALQRVKRLLGVTPEQAPEPGLYLWGGVGRGKTYLMDLFFEQLTVRRKLRIHFHRMLQRVHAELAELKDVSDPLDRVAQSIAQQSRVLCFDEFHVSDIADAMILGRLLEALFGRGVTLVATSNIPPEQLYAGGLQRQKFIPAIKLLQQHCQILNTDGGIDYRLRLLEQAGTFHYPLGSAAQEKLLHYFREIAPGETTEKRILDIAGRPIYTLRCAKGVAWFDFEAICDGPRSQTDYIEIARWYQTVIVSDIPILSVKHENQARRFIALVDEFYDRRVKLIVSAATSLEDLYQGQQLAFEFRRTSSRLTEMQSHDYLGSAHIP